MPRFIDAIIENPSVAIFRVVHPHPDEQSDWNVVPIHADLLAESDATDFEWLFVIKALNIRPDHAIRDCYMDMVLPERICSYAYFVSDGRLEVGYRHEFPGDIIPAVAIDCFGLYEDFYSRVAPGIGIEILRRGLAIARRKALIAQDLGYILRDEKRYTEAAEMFKVAVEEGPSSYFIHGELAGCFEETGEAAKAKKHWAMFERAGGAR